MYASHSALGTDSADTETEFPEEEELFIGSMDTPLPTVVIIRSDLHSPSADPNAFAFGNHTSRLERFTQQLLREGRDRDLLLHVAHLHDMVPLDFAGRSGGIVVHGPPDLSALDLAALPSDLMLIAVPPREVHDPFVGMQDALSRVLIVEDQVPAFQPEMLLQELKAVRKGYLAEAFEAFEEYLPRPARKGFDRHRQPKHQNTLAMKGRGRQAPAFPRGNGPRRS